MSDIDIERLREAARRVRHNYESGRMNVGMGVPTILGAIDFLLDLADEGGELWQNKRCEHGWERSHYLPHPEHQGPHVLENRYGPDCPHCDGGSRVRVWPKEET